ncbi:MAG: hypothetical protein ABW217_03905 [Polyangiaceae bacterium]
MSGWDKAYDRMLAARLEADSAMRARDHEWQLQLLGCSTSAKVAAKDKLVAAAQKVWRECQAEVNALMSEQFD